MAIRRKQNGRHSTILGILSKYISTEIDSKNKYKSKNKEEKKYLLEKNQFKINTDLKLNELKNKSEMVPKLQYYFEKCQKY